MISLFLTRQIPLYLYVTSVVIMMFYHIIRCLSIPLCIYNCRFFSFHYYVTSFVFYQKQNDHENSSFRKLVRNKWICRETCDIFFVINFLKFFDNPFQNILFLKEFLACNGCLGYLQKLKRGPGLAFGAHFLHDFSTKLYLIIIYQWTKFQCHTLFFLKISNKMCD